MSRHCDTVLLLLHCALVNKWDPAWTAQCPSHSGGINSFSVDSDISWFLSWSLTPKSRWKWWPASNIFCCVTLYWRLCTGLVQSCCIAYIDTLLESKPPAHSNFASTATRSISFGRGSTSNMPWLAAWHEHLLWILSIQTASAWQNPGRLAYFRSI